MSEKMKKLIKEAIYRLSQSDSDDLLLALNLDNELNNNKTFIEMLEGE